MLIRLNKLIFHRLRFRLNPDFFWGQFGSAALAPGGGLQAIERLCETFHDVLMKDVVQ